MTKALPFTKAGLKRAIAAAREAGMRVTGIRPDGTLMVIDDDPTLAPSSPTRDNPFPANNDDVWSQVAA